MFNFLGGGSGGSGGGGCRAWWAVRETTVLSFAQSLLLFCRCGGFYKFDISLPKTAKLVGFTMIILAIAFEAIVRTERLGLQVTRFGCHIIISW